MKSWAFNIIFLFALCMASNVSAQFEGIKIRKERELNKNWFTIENSSNKHYYDGFINKNYDVKDWKVIDVPHNWDDYGGYRRLLNGNLYGHAWYRRKFSVQELKKDQRCFLWFEGVGSYATVWVNGQKVGFHAGGRTSFTLDITKFVHSGETNLVCVRADEPTHIRDLPWVSGGDSKEIGFSEGSQPLGIFRPVHLIVTNQTRVIPFGVHIWNDTTVSEKSATLYLETRVKNYNSQSQPETISVINTLEDANGEKVKQVKSKVLLHPGEVYNIKQQFENLAYPHLWSLEEPYLYTVKTQVFKNGQCIDETHTEYGIRWISWPLNRPGGNNQFLLNGKPVYINGVCGYEHLMGQSHAFSQEQVEARVRQVEAAGFNAFRDAHQPHNLRFQKYWERDGILWWPQLAAHIWFDNPKFKENFKKLLHDWIIERRNNPAVILWGLENESTLPKEFAKECTNMIRKLDPTASVQRLVTTCNGGEGTDWNVPQNWSGTYGGNLYNYANEVQKEKLIGEYGAWRSIDLHTEGSFKQEGVLSENRMSELLELKVRQADSVKDKFCGQFMWLLHSHDNPGRVQSGEGYRDIDRVGPVNYKGLFTIWGEPVDAFYMYRANYVSGKEHPMVYIVSHTWPDRWTRPGIKNNITVYSNCDSVALFNDVNAIPLGVKTRGGIGTHFKWDSINVKYNVLYAIGYIAGKKVATDYIILNHLPEAPHFDLLKSVTGLVKPNPQLHYLYRVNCGGPTFKDHLGNLWMADRHLSKKDTWGSVSWTDHYKGMSPFFASQRRTFDPIKGTTDWGLFQTFRYGRHDLKYVFPVPDGEYTVELYFNEPWFGIGGGMDCKGWRLFDVAVNNEIKIHNLDIWSEVGTNHALKKTFKAHVVGGKLVISFPKVSADQAVLSGIAIASANKNISPAPPSPSLISNLETADPEAKKEWYLNYWLDTGVPQFTDKNTEISELPPKLFGGEWIQGPSRLSKTPEPWRLKFQVNDTADIYVGIDTCDMKYRFDWLSSFDSTGTYIENDKGRKFIVYHKRFSKGDTVTIGKSYSENLNSRNRFVVIGKYAANMVPTYDLKPTKSYHADAAMMKGESLSFKRLGNKEFVVFNSSVKSDTLEFNIKIGLAGKYSIRVKYANNKEKKRNLIFRLISNDGIVMQERQLNFPKTPPGKQRKVNIMTKTAINAGRYKIQLVSSKNSGEGIFIRGIEIQ